MCKPGKSFNTWVKVKFFITKCNEGRKPGHGRGSAPYRHSDSISRLWAMSKSDWLKRRARVRALSLEPLLNLACNSSCARNSLSNAGRTARWTLALRPAETYNARVNQRLCKRRNVAEPAA